MKKVEDGQFVMHDGIAKIVRLGRNAPLGYAYVEWTAEGSGDIKYGFEKISELSQYQGGMQ